MSQKETIQNKLDELGIVLPPAPKPVAAYVPAVATGSLVFTSGQLPMTDGRVAYTGKLGEDLDIQAGQEAARTCLLNCLAVIQAEVGSLERIARVVRLGAFVNSAPGFTSQPQVANGASELLLAIFGERGKHARAAVGVNELPLDAAVEVELLVEVSPEVSV